MAALVEPARHLPGPELCDLRSVGSRDLQAVLEEEETLWREALHWDFEKSAALVRRFVELRALNGRVLVTEAGVIGYCYYVIEDRKGLIGDLFVRRASQSAGLEQQLLNATLEELMATPFVTRIESQLMLLRSPFVRPLSGSRFLQTYPRNFLKLYPHVVVNGKSRRGPLGVTIEPWTEPHQEQAAHLIAATYQGHVDSRINDQYRSAAGARRFLSNIVQYPGCGTFFPPASFAACDRASGQMLGMCLASVVGEASGHITQVCIAPQHQGEGLGYELLRHSIEALRSHGCAIISLTVTSENRQAMQLYRGLGFIAARRFPAYVWEGW